MKSTSSRRQFLVQASALAGGAWLAHSTAAAEEQGAVPLAPPDRQPSNLPIPERTTRKVGWAVVGLGELALGEIMPAFRECKGSEPVALVSGHPDKAKKVATAHLIHHDSVYDYENFDRIAEDKRIEVVYIVLPKSMHAEFTIRALKAGKHVLCEKPMAATVEESEQMIAAAKEAKRKLGVAYRLHYEPFNRKVMELCRAKTFGAIKTISSSNCQNVKAPNIRLSGKLAGGPLGDVGVYSINACRYITGEEPLEVTGIANQPSDDPRFREVPESVAFTMRYPSGILAHCDCSFGSSESRRYRIHCAGGFIEMDPAFSYRGLRLRTKKGDAKTNEAHNTEIILEAVNHFAAEMDHFSEAVLNDRQIWTPGEMGLADMRIIAAIQEAARSGRTVKV